MEKKILPKIKINVEKKQIAVDELSFDQSTLQKKGTKDKKLDKKLIN